MDLVQLSANIPAELALQRSWIVYKLLPPDKHGKIQKIPINPKSPAHNPTGGDYNDPASWVLLKEALEYIKATKSSQYGVGYFFSMGSGYVGVDFDHCLDEKGDIADERVAFWVHQLDSYTEVSVSGTGLHVIVRGDYPKGIRRAWAEIYPHGRFFAMTGDTLPNFEEIKDRQEQVDSLAAALTGLATGSTPPMPGQENSDTPMQITREQLLESMQKFWQPLDVVLTRMTSGRSKKEIAALMEGDSELWKGAGAPYPSRSEADAALMLFLADYTNCNTQQMMQIFKSSGLDRTDEKPQSYYDITIETAINIVLSRTRPELATLSREHVEYLLMQEIDDAGHARCMEYLYGERFLNVVGMGWMQRGTTHWSSELAQPLLTMTTEALLRIRGSLAERNKLDRLEKASAVMAGRVRSVEYMFSAYTALGINEMDKDPYLLNVLNGVVDLRSGQLIHRTPSDFFSYCLPVPYNPDVTSELWQRTLYENVDENREMLHFVQRAVGYSFTGSTREEKMFYIYGPARSGKGVFTQTIQALMGLPLFTQVDFGVLTANRGDDRQNFSLAPLKASRFVSASESSKYEKLNEATVKTCTGRDAINAAFKYQTPFTFVPQFKVWLTSNHPPVGDTEDDAFWGRIATIHFPRTHLGAENVMLKESLEDQDTLTGILTWCVQGARAWYEEGLGIPRQVFQNTQQHRIDQDHIKQWMDEECTVNNDFSAPFEDLYASYKHWCNRNGVVAYQNRNFSKGLQNKGLHERRPVYTSSIFDPMKKARMSVIGVKLSNPSAVTIIRH